LKLSPTILILLLSQLSSFGQIDVGLKADINASTVIFRNQAYPFNWGYDAGLVVDWTLNKKLFLSTQLQYSQKGNEEYPGYLNLNYLSIPVLCGYHLSNRLSVMLGVETGILLHASNAYPGLTSDATYEFEPIDFCMNGSVRWLVSKKAGFYFSYVLSLDVIQRPIVAVPVYDTISNNLIGTYIVTTDHANNIRNQAYQMGIYYFFR
jgi:hypothetical protein